MELMVQWDVARPNLNISLTQLGPLGRGTTFPLIILFVIGHEGYKEMVFLVGNPTRPPSGNPEIGTPTVLPL